MVIKQINVNKITIWLVIDQKREKNQNGEIKNVENQFLCYFKLTPPSDLFYGELLRENGFTKIFNNPDEAIQYAEEELKNIF